MKLMMKQLLNRLIKFIILVCFGGLTYVFIEILWRGYSHWTMFIVGGIVFFLIGEINEIFTFNMSILLQMLISSILITTIEYISGMIINVHYHLNVWDYSSLPFNVNGQICLLFTILWFFLSFIGIVLDDYLRYWLWDEEKPHYKI